MRRSPCHKICAGKVVHFGASAGSGSVSSGGGATSLARIATGETPWRFLAYYRPPLSLALVAFYRLACHPHIRSYCARFLELPHCRACRERKSVDRACRALYG